MVPLAFFKPVLHHTQTLSSTLQSSAYGNPTCCSWLTAETPCQEVSPGYGPSTLLSARTLLERAVHSETFFLSSSKTFPIHSSVLIHAVHSDHLLAGHQTGAEAILLPRPTEAVRGTVSLGSIKSRLQLLRHYACGLCSPYFWQHLLNLPHWVSFCTLQTTRVHIQTSISPHFQIHPASYTRL